MHSAVYFDLDGTLIEYEDSFHELFENALGGSVSEEIYDYWTEQVLNNIRNMEEKPYLRSLEAVESEFNLGISPEKLADRYIEIEVSSTSVRTELKQVLEEISGQCKTGILTNGVGRVQMKKIRHNGLEALVDEIIISNIEEVRKPDPGIFELARERLEASNYVYVGDTYDEDIVPAQEAGFKTVHVTSGKRLRKQVMEKIGRV
ncbi:MAG: HAD family hydrolase [Candidatus Aenigmatarchaeota archaeon]